MLFWVSVHVSLPQSVSLSVLQTSQEPQVEDLQLVVQLHADDAVVSVNAQQDPRRLTVLPQDHLHLDTRNMAFSKLVLTVHIPSLNKISLMVPTNRKIRVSMICPIYLLLK